MAMISNRANDTPVQSQSERAAFFVCEPSQAMRAADRSEERREGKECRSRGSPYH